MDETIKKQLEKDPDGLLTYEYIANHMGACDDEMEALVANMIDVDKTGQFVVSAARYLYAISPDRYTGAINTLVNAAIEKDRERKYIGELLTAMWGTDYADRAEELKKSDDNFRRIYKRIFPEGI